MEHLIPSQKSDNDRKPRFAFEAIDKERATRLRKFALSMNWIASKGASNWEEPLAVLRRSLIDHSVIDAYLNWYIKWFRPGMRPEIRNGRELKTLWESNWLHELYAKHNPPKIEITDMARAIAEELGGPQADDSKFLAVIQQSLTKYGIFRDKLLAIWKKHDDSSKQELRTDWMAIKLKIVLFRNDLTAPRHFVTEWFRGIMEWKQANTDWSGFVVSELNEVFMNGVRSSLGDQANKIFQEMERD